MKFINDNKIPAYDETTGKGLIRHIYIRKGFHSGEIMVCLVSKTKSAVNLMKQMIAETGFLAKFPDVKSVVVNVNPDNTNVILGENNITVYGSDCIEDVMCGNKITLSPLSFYQVNTEQAEKLYGIAAEFADLKGDEEIFDLYCGAGTIGLSMADKVSHLTGVEVVKQAVENAKANAEANGISNADFICGDAGEIADRLQKEGKHPDVIIVDPPRKGCDQLTLDAIVKMSPKKIVMISCNPATAARDCKILCSEENGYKLERVKGVDLFPKTIHCETVALLSKLSERPFIEVEMLTDELDLTSAESKATYDEIKEYVYEKTALKVTSLNIAQVKRKYGIIERENYYNPGSRKYRQPGCTEEKEKAITEALKYFKMI
jgi:23S rRNA (uracil1939-C5)-methyltransferase